MSWAYRAIDLHGVASGLSAGTHTAELQYKGSSGTSYLAQHDTNGPAHVRLTALPLPAAQLSTYSYFWTVTPTTSGASTVWAALPTPITINFTVTASQSVLLLADLSRVQSMAASKNTWLRIVVDGTETVALSNTGDAYSYAYDAINLHGVATGLVAGSHSAEVQYKTQSGNAAYLPFHDTNGAGYARLTAVSESSSLLTTSSSFPSAPSPPMSSTVWASQNSLSTLTFTVSGWGGASALLIVDVARVQHGTASNNLELRILVDGTQEVALTNSGNAYGFAYNSRSFHGVATALNAGTHSAELQYKVQGGSAIFYSDLNGDQYLRMTAYAFPPPPPPRPPPAPPAPTPSPVKLAIGAPCVAAADCASNNCLCTASRRRASATTDRSRASGTSITSHDLGIEGNRSRKPPPRVQPQLPDLGVADGGYRYDAAETVKRYAKRARSHTVEGRRLFGSPTSGTAACACA